jgi:hypothetical protein
MSCETNWDHWTRASVLDTSVLSLSEAKDTLRALGFGRARMPCSFLGIWMPGPIIMISHRTPSFVIRSTNRSNVFCRVKYIKSARAFSCLLLRASQPRADVNALIFIATATVYTLFIP